jgi:RNA polymerase sigma factor FliA
MEERDQLILKHLPLVRVIAIRLRASLPAHVELEELIHAGILGLLDAAARYEVRRQIPFPSYSKYRIHGAMIDSLRRQDWGPRPAARDQEQETCGGSCKSGRSRCSLTMESPAPSDTWPDSMWARTHLRACLKAALDQLPSRHRAVITFYYVDQMTMTEIGDAMGIKQSRVSQIHKTALDRMALALTEAGIRGPSAF